MAKGDKKYSKTVKDPKTGRKKTVRYGTKGYSIEPGTSKGDSYCARSYGQMKKHPKAAKNQGSPLRLSRAKWNAPVRSRGDHEKALRSMGGPGTESGMTGCT